MAADTKYTYDAFHKAKGGLDDGQSRCALCNGHDVDCHVCGAIATAHKEQVASADTRFIMAVLITLALILGLLALTHTAGTAHSSTEHGGTPGVWILAR